MRADLMKFLEPVGSNLESFALWIPATGAPVARNPKQPSLFRVMKF